MPDYSDNLNNASSPKHSSGSNGLTYLLKKFGGPKIISTVLGMLLLAGGVGAGVALVMTPQLFKQSAAPLYDINADPLCGGVPKDRKSTRLNSSHLKLSRMPSSA